MDNNKLLCNHYTVCMWHDDISMQHDLNCYGISMHAIHEVRINEVLWHACMQLSIKPYDVMHAYTMML